MGSSALRSSGCGHDGAAARGATVDVVRDPCQRFCRPRSVCTLLCGYGPTECALLPAGDDGMTPALMA